MSFIYTMPLLKKTDCRSSRPITMKFFPNSEIFHRSWVSVVTHGCCVTDFFKIRGKSRTTNCTGWLSCHWQDSGQASSQLLDSCLHISQALFSKACNISGYKDGHLCRHGIKISNNWIGSMNLQCLQFRPLLFLWIEFFHSSRQEDRYFHYYKALYIC